MRRIRLFEFEDQNWCPSFIRETTTDVLMALYRLHNIYEPALRKIGEVLEKTKATAIVDCCSGSGGPVKQLREYLDKTGKKSVKITLTDKYPNQALFEHIKVHCPNKTTACKDSLDAAHFPPSMKGMRTLFSSFHHFKPHEAIKILQDAVNHNAPIGIFECTQRCPKDFMRMLFSPIFMLFMVPFAKRLNWKKFIFTYLLPITPFTHAWDFLVSILRTYSPRELQTLIEQLDAPHYHWEIGKLWSRQAKCYVTYLVGYNKGL
jgi:hypothetical protein